MWITDSNNTKKIIYRIDDRLIHGQVVEGWVHNLDLTRITIVSDRVKEDGDYRKMLEFSVPREIKVDIFSIREMSDKVKERYLEDEATIVLFESSYDVLSLLDYGVRIDLVIVGCLHYNGSNRPIRKSVAVSEEDIRNFEDIYAMGTTIHCQALPKDRRIDLMELIKRMK